MPGDKTILVSFIVPFYNTQKYISQCLESIINQKLNDIEILCVDDGSTDGSAAVVGSYATIDPRIKLIANASNLGAALARNRGLDAAKGRFVRMVDADDVLPPGSTAAMIERAEATGADLVRGALVRFTDNQPDKPEYVVDVPERRSTLFSDEPSIWSPWWHTTYLIRSDLLQDPAVRYPDLRKGEDPVFLAEVLVRAKTISLMSDIVYLYRGYPKTTGSAGSSFVDVINSLQHAAHVRKLYCSHHAPAWTESYGPFLKSTYHRYVSRCALDAHQVTFVNREAAEIWEGGLGIAPPAGTAPQDKTNDPERRHWETVFGRKDPWSYTSPYEKTKYEHTIEMMPQHARKALEIGCAEGHFTRDLALRSEYLVAIDIAESALARARQNCAHLPNCSFIQYDINDGLPGYGYDLIVCSEILYYMRDANAIARLAGQVRDCLAEGGKLVMTHSVMVSDDRDNTGFDFHSIGAKGIGEIFAACAGLTCLQELRTDLYRVQVFGKTASAGIAPYHGPQEALLRTHAHFDGVGICWGGCSITAAEASHLWQLQDVPVLMYHQITDHGPASLAPYRVSPAAFERQLAWLKRHGWHGMDLDAYCRHRFKEGAPALPGKPVILTFDDAYLDFYTSAWPLLRKYGYSATVFIPVDYVGGHADWDSAHGPVAPLMTWQQIGEVHKAGIRFGGHSCVHRRSSEMTREELMSDAVRCKSEIEARLNEPITGYCYPYATATPDAREAVQAAGFHWAVCSKGNGPLDRSDRYYLPRIEIFGSDDVERFVSRLPAPMPTDVDTRKKYHEMAARRDRALYMRTFR